MFKKVLLLLFTCFAFSLVFAQEETTQNLGQNFKFYFYPVQNANASNLAEILSNISGNINQQTKASNKKKGKQLSIVADKETNSLIIYANPAQYSIIKNAIEDLDVIRPQVFVEALIVEIGVNKTLNLGVKYSRNTLLNPDNANSGLGNLSTPSGFGGVTSQTPEGARASGTGSLLGVIGNIISYNGVDYLSYAAFVQALATDREVDILSNPKILTLNNKKATIQVGENRPFLTSITRDSNNNAIPNYSYKDLGILLDILPQINAGDYVNMEIKQENTSVSGFAQADLLTEDRPITSKRTLITQVVVKSGETIALGGLISDEKVINKTKVPCLGDIPLLGYLFRNQTTSSKKTNLVVFLTPTIVRTAEEQRKISEKALKQTKTPLKEISKKFSNIPKTRIKCKILKKPLSFVKTFILSNAG